MRISIGALAALLLLTGIIATSCAVSSASDDKGPTFTELLFVTDRADRSGDAETPRFGGQRGPVRHGRCEVRFRNIPLTGGLARALDTHVPTEIRDLHDVTPMTGQAFDDALRATPSTRPVVLFVHGYAYGFARACRQGAELQRRLGDRATVVLFTWPSDGNPMDYGSDRGDAEWAALDFAALLERLNADVGPDRLRIAAHSMGSRTVLGAMTHLRLKHGVRTLADRLVLLAPDYDTASFRAEWPLLAPMVRHATMYASDNDRPLGASASLHDEPRLGQAGKDLTVIDDLQTIDVSPLGRYHPSGHEYHRYHPVAVEDFIAVLLDEADATERALPVLREQNGRRYFELIDAEDRSAD